MSYGLWGYALYGRTALRPTMLPDTAFGEKRADRRCLAPDVTMSSSSRRRAWHPLGKNDLRTAHWLYLVGSSGKTLAAAFSEDFEAGGNFFALSGITRGGSGGRAM